MLEETHQITFHQRCINFLIIEVYKYLNEHSTGIMNDIFKLRENAYNLQNFHIFQTKNSHLLKYGLDALPYHASQLSQQVHTYIREAASLTLSKNIIIMILLLLLLLLSILLSNNIFIMKKLHTSKEMYYSFLVEIIVESVDLIQMSK